MYSIELDTARTLTLNEDGSALISYKTDKKIININNEAVLNSLLLMALTGEVSLLRKEIMKLQWQRPKRFGAP